MRKPTLLSDEDFHLYHQMAHGPRLLADIAKPYIPPADKLPWKQSETAVTNRLKNLIKRRIAGILTRATNAGRLEKRVTKNRQPIYGLNDIGRGMYLATLHRLVQEGAEERAMLRNADAATAKLAASRSPMGAQQRTK